MLLYVTSALPIDTLHYAMPLKIQHMDFNLAKVNTVPCLFTAFVLLVGYPYIYIYIPCALKTRQSSFTLTQIALPLEFDDSYTALFLFISRTFHNNIR